MDIASSLLVPDWPRGSTRGNQGLIQGVVISETGFKPSLRPPGGPEDPLVIGPRGGTEICDWLDLLDQISPNLAKFEMKRLSPLIGR